MRDGCQIKRSVSLASQSHSQVVRLDTVLSLAMGAWQKQMSANAWHHQQVCGSVWCVCVVSVWRSQIRKYKHDISHSMV